MCKNQYLPLRVATSDLQIRMDEVFLLTDEKPLQVDSTNAYFTNLFIYLLTYLLTKLSPSRGAANCETPQELPSILWNPKVQYRVHKSPPLVPILSHIHPILSF
jgi:hypothetical protein